MGQLFLFNCAHPSLNKCMCASRFLFFRHAMFRCAPKIRRKRASCAPYRRTTHPALQFYYVNMWAKAQRDLITRKLYSTKNSPIYFHVSHTHTTRSFPIHEKVTLHWHFRVRHSCFFIIDRRREKCNLQRKDLEQNCGCRKKARSRHGNLILRFRLQ